MPAGRRGLYNASEASELLRKKLTEEKPSGTKYKQETFQYISRWTEATKVKYGPNPKTKGSKSHPRYEKYMKAKNVGEAIRLGAYPVDLLWDFERGFYKVDENDPNIREEPLDLMRAQVEKVPLTKTDFMLGRWFVKELCRKVGVSQLELSKGANSLETTIMRGQRMLADQHAKLILDSANKEKRIISNDDILSVLRKWSYYKNPYRMNVMSTGETWVNSDTVGVSCTRDGDVKCNPSAKRYPNVMKVMTKYMRDRQPAELGCPFHFTSINMNFGYGAVRHRDSNNLGLSMLAGFGDFTGGELQYFPDDDGSVPKTELQKLNEKDSISVDMKKNMLLFDGCRTHAVKKFKGERYSLVWFSASQYHKVRPDDLKKLKELGFVMPTSKSVATICSSIRKPKGAKTKHGALTWASDRK